MIFFIKSLILFFSTLCISSISNAQSFNIVGNCKFPYPNLDMGFYNNKLIINGADTICGLPLNGTGLWSGSSWSTLGQMNGAWAKDFCEYNNELYAAGLFTEIGNQQIIKVARWDGQNWNGLGTGLSGTGPVEKLEAIEQYKGEIYIGGKFGLVDGKSVQNIARWNGTEWNSVGSGVTASLPWIYSMVEYKNELYVGGNLSVAGGKTAYNIARWNGEVWNTLKLGLNNTVKTMIVDSVKNILYVGGSFNAVNNSNIKGSVVAWDGINWLEVGDGISYHFNSAVLALEMYHGYLYAAGISNNNTTDTVLARWDGIKWEPIIGFDGPITSLATFQDELYIGGYFTRIGNDTIPYLTRYYSPDYVSVGIDNNIPASKSTIKIYPNPSRDLLQIESQTNINSYKITDLNGRVIQEEKIKKEQSANTTFAISINKLNKGIYFIHVFDETQKNIGTEKFVID